MRPLETTDHKGIANISFPKAAGVSPTVGQAQIQEHNPMNSSTRNTSHANPRSQEAGLIKQKLRCLLALSRVGAILFLVLLAMPAARAQEVADTIRVRTRVVFMDALVKDKKTGIPISDLKQENFELFDD